PRPPPRHAGKHRWSRRHLWRGHAARGDGRGRRSCAPEAQREGSIPMKPVRFLSMLGIAVIGFALPFTAGATVTKEGAWPSVEKRVDLEFDGRPSEGLKQLAKEADWSLVVANTVAIDGDGNVHVDVDDQPADAVLDALFVGRDVVAHRNGKLITVTPANAA